jgi:hypothetical protein
MMQNIKPEVVYFDCSYVSALHDVEILSVLHRVMELLNYLCVRELQKFKMAAFFSRWRIYPRREFWEILAMSSRKVPLHYCKGFLLLLLTFGWTPRSGRLNAPDYKTLKMGKIKVFI